MGTEKLYLRVGRKKIKLPIEEIAEKYENGINIEDIAKEYEISCSTIYIRLKEYYKNMGTQRPSKLKDKNEKFLIDEIVEKYEKGTIIKELVKEYGMSYNTINIKLKEYYEEKGKEVPRVLKSLDVIEEYLSKGLTIEEINQIASKKNIIIPQELVNKFNNKNIMVDEER